MKRQLVYVFGKYPGMDESIVSRYLESDFGFFRISPNEITKDGEKEGIYRDLHSVTYRSIAFFQSLMEAKIALKDHRNVVLDDWINLHFSQNGNIKHIRNNFIEPFKEDDLKRSMILINVDREVALERFLQSYKEKNSDFPVESAEENFKQRFIRIFREYSRDMPYLNDFESAGFDILRYEYNTQEDLIRIKQDLGLRFIDLSLENPVKNRAMRAKGVYSVPMCQESITKMKID